MAKSLKIRAILQQYQQGDLDKYEAMDALDADTVYDLYALLAEYKIPPATEPIVEQLGENAPALEEYFKGE